MTEEEEINKFREAIFGSIIWCYLTQGHQGGKYVIAVRSSMLRSKLEH